MDDLKVKGLPFAKTVKGRYEVWDSKFPTFGIRVGLTAKSWVLMFRENRRPYKLRRKTIGQWPRISYEEAKDIAHEFHVTRRRQRIIRWG